MKLYYIDSNASTIAFPDLSYAWGMDTPAPGLLAQGGDLSVERLRLAYSEGIFPWYSESSPILWWSLDPRMVLYPQHFKLSRSLRKTLKKFLLTQGCEIRIDTAFEQVMCSCAQAERVGQNGTWITSDIIQAYTRLHHLKLAHSVEAWFQGELLGGLYGVNLGGMFYGESMFSFQTDASKLALCGLIAFARYHHIQLIDCQQETAHLKSLGAYTIPRDDFVLQMKQAQTLDAPQWPVGSLPRECWTTFGL